MDLGGRRCMAAVERMSVQSRESLLAIGQLMEAVTGLKPGREWLGAASAPLRRKAHRPIG